MSRDRAAEPLPLELDDTLAGCRSRLEGFASRVLYFSTTSSTNDVAAALAATGDAEGVVIIADTQTAGRGRRGHTWFSPPANGLYVSVVLEPRRAREDMERATSLLTLAAGVAIAEAIEIVTGLAVHIKWPNDLLTGGRKLAGILAEAISTEARVSAVVLGYGINVGAMAYPPELADRATSLELELGRRIDRWLLAAETLCALGKRYRQLLAGGFDAILDDWSARSPGSRGARIRWASATGPRTGTTLGVDAHGALLVRDGVGVERIVAGELTWL